MKVLREEFNKSILIHHDVINSIISGENDDARDLMDTIGVRYSKRNIDLVDELLLVAVYIADDYIEQSGVAYDKQALKIVLFSVGSLLILLISLIVLTKNINVPLRRLVVAIKEAEDAEAEIILDTIRKDEIGKVSSAFIKMIENARVQRIVELELIQENFKKLFSNIHLGTSLSSLVKDEDSNIIDYITIEENKSFHKIIDALNDKKSKTYRDDFLEIIKKSYNQNISFSTEINIEDTDMHFHITAFPLQEE